VDKLETQVGELRVDVSTNATSLTGCAKALETVRTDASKWRDDVGMWLRWVVGIVVGALALTNLNIRFH
jgi:hypothetical protein